MAAVERRQRNQVDHPHEQVELREQQERELAADGAEALTLCDVAYLDELEALATNLRTSGCKVRTLKAGWGLNAASGEYVDMFKAGIIDPTKVVRTALQDAASVAGLLITTEAAVSELPEDKPAMQMGGGGMGGMGGMDF